MNSKLISILVAGLFAGGSALAADDELTWSGTVGIGARATNTDGGTRNGARGTSGTTSVPFAGPADEAKANEFRDIKNSGVLGIVDVEGSNNRYYVRFFGENFGRDDQYLNLRGGGYGTFKYQLYEDKMPHNLSWNALTPFGGTGGAVLTSPGGVYPNSPNPATWNGFDYKLQRNNTGGNVEVTANSPWHIRADYNEITTKGVRPQSGRLGTGSGNGFVEFGAPVDYKTKNFTLDGGYAVKQGSVNVTFLSSRFNNSNDLMTWPNFYMQQGTDTNLLPPDNQLTKWSVNGALRQLPASSTLAARFSYSKLTNNFGVMAGGLLPTSNGAAGPGGSPTAVGTLLTNPSSSTFNGEHVTKTGSLSLTSTPMKGLDSRIYYNYYDKKNDSTQINYAGGGLGTTAAACNPAASSSSATNFCIGGTTGSLFAYKKVDFGVDLGYRINPQHKISGGFNDLKVDREGREDATSTKDRKLWAEYKNTMLEDLSGRLKYQWMDRRSNLNPSFAPGASGILPTSVSYYFRAYDISNFDQDQIKLVLDWTAMPFLDFGLETAWKKTDYKDYFYGRTDDKRTEHNLTVSYGDPKVFRITGLANWENVVFNQAYRNIAAGQSPLPGGTQTATTFDWGTKNTQTNRLLALIADWPVMERLTLKGSYTWTKTGGGVDFTSGNTAGAGGFSGGPLVNYVTDNTKKRTLNLKGDYKYDKNWNITLGYVHEKYLYDDAQMRSYQGFYPYFQNLGTTNISWLSGAFANPSYKLDVLYVMGTYRFN